MSIITGKGTNDSLLGTLKDDVISGGGGNDTIRGAGGNDVLTGGAGNDLVFSDVFVFEGTRAANGFDTITDYQWWNTGTGKGDKLDLSNITAFTSKSDINDFVHFAFVGSNLVMYVDPDGTGSKYGFDAWAQFQNVEMGGNLRLKIGGYTFDVNIPANNHPPEIVGGGSGDAYICIAENIATVTTVTASDADIGDTLTYSISGGVDASLFTINGSTGALSFITAPNFEAPADSGSNNVYDVTVQVSDSHLATDSRNIHVTVNNVEETPVITSNGAGSTAAVTVSENSTAVTTVVATDGDGTTPTYSIVGGADSARFTISSTTGALSFLTAPNFEAPNDSGANNVYDVTVRASDGVLFDDQAIAVSVINQNEPPVITSGSGAASIALSISENTTAVTTVTATDVDAGTTLTYSIVGGADSSLFTINSSGALSFITGPNFEAPLDAGSNNGYDLTVQVSDGLLTDAQAILVTVNNVAEAPVITSNSGGSTAATNVAENSTSVTTVVAVDGDGTTPTYSIVGGADSSRFTISITTGALSFITAPNFEAPNDSGANNVYDVTVRASDGVLFDDQAIAVTVTNANEAPTITSNGSGTTAAVSVTENTTAVTTVTATDVDAGTTLTYSITGGADSSLFTIVGTSGALSFITAPDYETPLDSGSNNVYDVTVQVSDGSLFDTQALAVTVSAVRTAVADHLIYGFNTTGNITVPGWALMANDNPSGNWYDVLVASNAWAINSVSGSGASLSAPDVTYGGLVANGTGSFTYDYSGTAAATVSTTRSAVDTTLSGGSGDDILVGGKSNTAYTMTGSGGKDVLVGNTGNDVMNGGEGSDIYSGGGGVDALTLTETTAVTDYVRLDGIITNGNLDNVVGFAAGSAGTRDIVILGDANTSNSTAGVQIVTITPTTTVGGATVTLDTTLGDIFKLVIDPALDADLGASTTATTLVDALNTDAGNAVINCTAGGAGYILAYDGGTTGNSDYTAYLYYFNDANSGGTLNATSGGSREIDLVGTFSNVALDSFDVTNFVLI